MKLTIEGNAEEIKNVLQAIGGSKEHEEITAQIKTLQTSLASTFASISDAQETADEALAKAAEASTSTKSEKSNSYFSSDKGTFVSAVANEKTLTVVINTATGIKTYKLIRN
jgi:hypothetical protein